MDNSSTIKKNYKLMGTENDPVVIAQRLLNLYRQLHIFSPEKKAAYNQMLLEQTPEIKKTLGTLPGGIVVQQYIADIEAEEGLKVETFDSVKEKAPEQTTSFLKSETAPSPENQAQIQPTVVSVASDPEMIRSIVNTFRDALETSERNQQQNTKELVQSILAVSEQNRKEDTKELAQTIVALQNKLTQTILEKQASEPRIVQADNQNFVVSGEPNVLSMEQLEKVIRHLSEAQSAVIREMASSQSSLIKEVSNTQSDLIREMTVTQTQELSREMGRVLKEIQQMSNQALIDTVQTVHRENMDFFKNQMTSSVSMTPIAEGAGLPRQSIQMPAEDEPQQQKNTIFQFTSEETSSRGNKRKNKKKKEAEIEPLITNEAESTDEHDFHWQEVAEQLPETVTEDESVTKETYPDEEYEWAYVEDDNEEETLAEETLEEKTTDLPEPEEEILNEQIAELNETDDLSVENLPSFEDQQSEPEETSPEEPQLSEQEEEEHQVTDINDETQEVFSDNNKPEESDVSPIEPSTDEASEEQEDLISQEDQTNLDEDDGEYEWEYVEDTGDEQNGDTVSEPSANIEPVAEASSEADDEEYEWEYVEDDAETSDAENLTEDEEYEWEYVEDDGTENVEENLTEETPSETEVQTETVFEGSEENLTDLTDTETEPASQNLQDEQDITPYDLSKEETSLTEVDNLLLSTDTPLVFETEEKSEEPIILNNDFGISSEDGTSIQPS